MNLMNMGSLLAMGQPPSAPGTTANPQGQMVYTIGMLVIMFVMFYFVLIRPQSKKAKQHAEMLKSVRPGDRVLTSGGIVGVVLSVKEKTISLRSADAKFEVVKSAVTEITERSGESSSSES